MKQETKQKISAALKGRHLGPRPPIGIVDLNIERMDDGERLRLDFFNDVGGRTIAEFRIHKSKAASWGRALLAASEEGPE